MTNLQCHKNFTKVRKIEWAFPGGERKSSKNERLPEPRFYWAHRTSSKFNQRTKGGFCCLFA